MVEYAAHNGKVVSSILTKLSFSRKVVQLVE